jgi:hypothetical protein
MTDVIMGCFRKETIYLKLKKRWNEYGTEKYLSAD